MGASTSSKHDLEMIEICWTFVKDKKLRSTYAHTKHRTLKNF